MAFIATDLVLLGGGNGYNHYRYDTADTAATVDTVGYFNNSDDSVNLAVGDMVDVVVWTTSTGTAPIVDVTRHIVMAVGAVTAGDVNLSDDLLGATLVSGD